MVDSWIKTLKVDLPAGIVVFFVAVPLCLGIAVASGAPPLAGLIAGIVGGIIVGSISGSALGVSGPAAGLVVIVVESIQSLGSFQAFLMAVVLGGTMQMALAALKAGVIAYYFPSSVIKGMLTGIGLVIILKQLPHAVGYDVDFEGDDSFFQPDGQTTLSELYNMFEYISPGAVLISLISLAILLAWELYLIRAHKFFRLIQGPLVAVLAGILFQSYATVDQPSLSVSSEHLVNVPISEGISGVVGQFVYPDLGQLGNPAVWLVAFTIAVVASLETLLCVEATDKLDPRKRVTPVNRELVAQGVGNLCSGMIGGLPVTQVIVRSSANIQSGAHSRLSTVLHGIFLLVCIIVIPNILNLIPLAVLACILLVVGYKLAKPSLFMEMYKLGWAQFLPFVATITGIVFIDLLKGISLGLVVGIVVILRDNFNNSHFMHIKESNGNHKVRMRLAEEISFLNKGAILNELNKLPKGTELTIDMRDCFSVDYDVAEIIENFRSTALDRDISVSVIPNETLNAADN